MEREVGAVGFLISHQQLAKAVEPGVGDLHHPSPGWGTLLRTMLLGPRAHVRNVVPAANRLFGGSAAKTGIEAQMLPGVPAGMRAAPHDSVEHRLELSDVVMVSRVTMIDGGMPRASTHSIRLLPFFPGPSDSAAPTPCLRASIARTSAFSL